MNETRNFRDTGFNGPNDQEYDPWIPAPKCGHKVIDEEIDANGYCINCSAWRAFKKNLLWTAIGLTLFIGSALYVAWVMAQ